MEMKIIPAIDIINGECVRLTKGAYSTKKVYSTRPLEVAKMFADKGFTNLHLVDLDGAKQGQPVNLRVLEAITAGTTLSVDYGGGLRTTTSVEAAFGAGAAAITAGSIAVRQPEVVVEWIKRWGAERITIGADFAEGKIATEGWQQVENVEIVAFISSYLNMGAKRFICTDVGKDGMLLGSAIECYRSLLNLFPTIELVASGGVSSLEEVRALKSLGLWGAIVGKSIYEGRVDINELAKEV